MRLASPLLVLALLASTARADDFAPPPPPPPEKPSMKPALIATSVSVVLVGLSAGAYYKFHESTQHLHTRIIPLSDPQALEKATEDQRNTAAWRDRLIGMVVITVVSSGVTGYMWSRREQAPTINVTPMNGGMRVSLARSF